MRKCNCYYDHAPLQEKVKLARKNTQMFNLSIGISRLIALHRCCFFIFIFYQLKARPFISKKVITLFIAILTLL